MGAAWQQLQQHAQQHGAAWWSDAVARRLAELQQGAPAAPLVNVQWAQVLTAVQGVPLGPGTAALQALLQAFTCDAAALAATAQELRGWLGKVHVPASAAPTAAKQRAGVLAACVQQCCAGLGVQAAWRAALCVRNLQLQNIDKETRYAHVCDYTCDRVHMWYRCRPLRYHRESLSGALVHCCTAAAMSPLLPCCVVAGCVGLAEAVRVVAESESVADKGQWLGVLLGEGAQRPLEDARTWSQHCMTHAPCTMHHALTHALTLRHMRHRTADLLHALCTAQQSVSVDTLHVAVRCLALAADKDPAALPALRQLLTAIAGGGVWCGQAPQLYKCLARDLSLPMGGNGPLLSRCTGAY